MEDLSEVSDTVCKGDERFKSHPLWSAVARHRFVVSHSDEVRAGAIT